jgi:hypothetical protein
VAARASFVSRGLGRQEISYAKWNNGTQVTAKAELLGFIARFSPRIARLARSALTVMRERLPGAYELVYDNAYALVVGFGPTERPSEAVFSIVIHPRKVSLCFLWGVYLRDPDGLLAGSGRQVRHIRLENAATLDKPAVRALIAAAIEATGNKFEGTRPGCIIIRAISKNRRPRRPTVSAS